MRLKEVVELPELKKRDIIVIGHYTTDGVVFAILARRGEKLFHFLHLVEDGPKNPDPELHKSEVDTILRHFIHKQLLVKL